MKRATTLAAAVTALLLLTLAMAGPAVAITTGTGVWSWVKPVPQGNQVWDVDAVGTDTAWAVGAGGTVLRTDDAGATWSSAGPRTSDVLFAVDFVDADHGWIAGAGGVVWRTADGGATWSRAVAAAGRELSAVSFADTLHGVAVGAAGTVAGTADGGVTWTWGTAADMADLSDVKMVGPTEAWAVGFGSTILHSVDGGLTWPAHVPDCSPALSGVGFTAIAAGDADHLWAVGTDGAVLHTASGGDDPDGGGPGTAWVWRSIGLAKMMNDVVFLGDDLTGWVVGEDGYVYGTENGGTSWTGQDGRHSAAIESIAAWTTQKAVFAGYHGAFSRTVNGGTTWTRLSDDSWASFDGVDAVGAGMVAVADAGGHVRVTNDGGGTWSDVATSAGALSGVDFVSALSGWAAGDGGAILASVDGGASWNPQTSGTTEYLEDVAFGDSTHGWAVGTNGAITATVNGSTWAPQDAGTTVHFLGVDAVGEQAWAVGMGGNVYHKGGSLLGWQQQYGAGYHDLYDVCFVDALEGWAVGASGTIIHTTTGGEDPDGDGPLFGWAAQTDISGPVGELYGVAFADSEHGWAVGAGGAVVVTSDGGATWTTQSSGCWNWFEGVAYGATGTVWAVGRAGTIMKLEGVTDATPPATTDDAPAGWVNGDVTVTLTASDAGSGVQFVTLGGSRYDPASATYAFDVDPWTHNLDGVNTVSYSSVDNAGNREAGKSFIVRVDTRAPVTRAPEAETVRRGRYVALKYRVNETGPNGGTARVTIKIKTRSGVTKKTIKIAAAKPVGKTLSYRFRCKLPARKYRYYVYATDAAGNAQQTVGSNRLTVR